MIGLYQRMPSLLARIHYSSMNVALKAERISRAEDILASALAKGGIAPEVARDSAFRYVSGVLDGLRRTTAEAVDE